jgi:membrane protein
MTLKEQRLENLNKKILEFYTKEKESLGLKKIFYLIARWFCMLAHEFIKDDVKVRAESLSFLMVFSILPLIAGAFFVFNIFSQFAYVQESIQNFIDQWISNIPKEHQEFLMDYVLKFKDAYLENVSKKSSTIGIFAVFFLFWIGLQTYNNMDSVINVIWSADKKRSILENIRNFIVVTFFAPIVITATMSLPIILSKINFTKNLFIQVPFLKTLYHYLIPIVLLWFTFFMIYKFIPVVKVKNKSAFIGSVFTTIGLFIANLIVQLYFKYGTNSAYGKAASVPIVFFWIYLIWIIIIMGAELSFLAQNEKIILNTPKKEKSLIEGEVLLLILKILLEAFKLGANPVSLESLVQKTNYLEDKIKLILRFLIEKGLVLEVVGNMGSQEMSFYSLAKDIESLSLEELLRDFYKDSSSLKNKDGHLEIKKMWHESLKTWFEFFKDKKI